MSLCWLDQKEKRLRGEDITKERERVVSVRHPLNPELVYQIVVLGHDQQRRLNRFSTETMGSKADMDR